MVNAKAKAGLRSSIMVRNADFCYSRSYCPSYNPYTKVQIQGLIVKKFKFKMSKFNKSKPVDRRSFALPCTNKLAKSTRQEKKRSIRKKSETRKILL